MQIWHASFIRGMTHTRVTWLIHRWHDSVTVDMPHYRVTWLIHTCHASFTCDMTHLLVTWLIYMWLDSFATNHLLWRKVTLSQHWVLQCVAVWCGVLRCVAVCCSVLQCVAATVAWYCDTSLNITFVNTWLFTQLLVTHSHVWHDSLTCVTWLTHMCEHNVCQHLALHSVTRNSLTCVTWLTHMCDMTHSYVRT